MNSGGMNTQQKDALALSLAQTLLRELENGAVEYDEAREISREILFGLEEVKTEDDEKKFLDILRNKWSFFNSVAQVEKAKQAEQHVDEKIDDIRNQLLQLINRP